MKLNWINAGGVWYYLKADGVMATGWLNDNGTWYYLNVSGAMLANTTVDGYTLNASGAWVK
jgi:glucan-binding YG repeat protein